MNNQKYFIATVSKDHTIRGVCSGFMQVCHGKQAPLKKMKKGDWIIVYSPKQTMEGTTKCQAFTAIGQATDEDIYQFQMTESFIPYRRNIKFHACTEVSILPLIGNLEFIRDKKSWGFPFRFGFFEINEKDFNLIVSKMIIQDETGRQYV